MMECSSSTGVHCDVSLRVSSATMIAWLLLVDLSNKFRFWTICASIPLPNFEY
jgi:hypothetical protein